MAENNQIKVDENAAIIEVGESRPITPSEQIFPPLQPTDWVKAVSECKRKNSMG